MKIIKAWLLLIAVLMTPTTFATGADKLATILDQQRTLAADLDAGHTGDLTPRQVNAVRKAQKEVFALTEGKDALAELSIDEKVGLENALERINAEVKGGHLAKDDQEVCWRERTSGSQLKSTRCGTEAERREAREGARDFMEKPKVCAGDCGSMR
jgi:hypothetical protein